MGIILRPEKVIKLLLYKVKQITFWTGGKKQTRKFPLNKPDIEAQKEIERCFNIFAFRYLFLGEWGQKQSVFLYNRNIFETEDLLTVVLISKIAGLNMRNKPCSLSYPDSYCELNHQKSSYDSTKLGGVSHSFQNTYKLLLAEGIK